MREPVFNETLQLGIVVRDLEATMLTSTRPLCRPTGGTA